MLFGDLSLFYFRSLDLFWVLLSQGLFTESCLFDFFLSFLWVFHFRDWPFGESAPLGLSLWVGCILFSFSFFFFFLLNLFCCLSVFFFRELEECARFLFFPPSKGLCSAIVGKVLKGESCSWSFLLLLLVVCVIWGPDADLGILFSSVREFFGLLTVDRLEFLLLAQMQKKNSSDVFWRFCFTFLVVDEMPHQRFYRRFCFPLGFVASCGCRRVSHGEV